MSTCKKSKVAFAAILMLSVCTLFFASGTAFAAKHTLRLGHVLQENSTYHECSKKFAELLAEKTGGDIAVTIFPAGQLGNERELYEGVEMGTLDVAYCAVSTLPAWLPSFMVFDLPFLYDNYETEYKVLDGKLGQHLTKELESIGMICLGYAETGFANDIYNGTPIKVPADAKGRTFRTKQSVADMEYRKAYGVNPVPMAWGEVFTALQTGVIDGGNFPMNSLYASKFNTVVKYMTVVNATGIPTALVISKTTMDRIPEEYHAAIREAGREAILYKRKIQQEWDDDCLKKMQDEGLTVIYADTKLWRDELKEKVYKVLVPSLVPAELVAMVEEDSK